MRILVVGAGIAGSSFTRFARAAGHTVHLIASHRHPRASEAAVCVISPSWFTGDTLTACRWTLNWYQQQCWLLGGAARHSSYRRPDSRMRDGFFGIHPLAPLLDPDDHRVFEYGEDLFEYDAVLLCRGAAGSDLDWKRLPGATTILPGRIADQIRSYEERPRFTTFALAVDDVIRFGSTSGLTGEAALERQIRSERAARAAGVLPLGDAHRVTGVRLMPPTMPEAGPLRRLSERTWALEGFGRVGYSLAPYRAFRALSTIESEVS